MKRKILIFCVVAAVIGIGAVVFINQKTKRIQSENQAAAAAAADAAKKAGATEAKTNALVVAKVTAPAPENLADFKAKPGGKARIEGTSTVHDWYAEGSIISGVLKIDKAALAQPKPGPVYATAKVLIPVTSLKSSSGAPMDNVMYGPKGFDTEKGADYQRILYTLESLVITKAPATPDGPIECDAVGELMIHATTNKVSFPVTIAKDESGGLLIKAKTKIKMSTFSIPPPEVDIVVKIVTGDDVNVILEWKLAPVSK